MGADTEVLAVAEGPVLTGKLRIPHETLHVEYFGMLENRRVVIDCVPVDGSKRSSTRLGSLATVQNPLGHYTVSGLQFPDRATNDWFVP